MSTFGVYWRVVLGALGGVLFGALIGGFLVTILRDAQWTLAAAMLVFPIAGGAAAAFGASIDSRS